MILSAPLVYWVIHFNPLPLAGNTRWMCTGSRPWWRSTTPRKPARRWWSKWSTLCSAACSTPDCRWGRDRIKSLYVAIYISEQPNQTLKLMSCVGNKLHALKYETSKRKFLSSINRSNLLRMQASNDWSKLYQFQALDEEYLKVDAQFGGVDQRKIFMFAEKVKCFYYVHHSI